MDLPLLGRERIRRPADPMKAPLSLSISPSVHSGMVTSQNIDPVVAEIRATGKSLVKWMFFYWATINIYFALIR
jgi:hypothetical protein